MRPFWTLIPACLILAAAAAAHGWRTDRWGDSGELQAAAVRLQTLPLRVGDWDGVAIELPQDQVTAARAAGSIVHRYTHRYSRAEVTLMVLCGRPGPISVHPPDVCYGASGFVAGPARTEPLSEGNTAWTADFTRSSTPPESLRIRWAWCDGGAWSAADTPRTTYARSQILYKLYLVRPLPAKADPAAGSPELDLMTALLPSLRSVIATP